MSTGRKKGKRVEKLRRQGGWSANSPAGSPARDPIPPWLAGPRHVGYRLVASHATACCNGAFTAAYPPREPRPSGP